MTQQLLRQLAALVRNLTERVVDYSTLGVRNRIPAELVRMAREAGIEDNQATLEPLPRHADIASRVSTNREAVAREIAELTRKGLLEKRKGGLTIVDVEASRRDGRRGPRGLISAKSHRHRWVSSVLHCRAFGFWEPGSMRQREPRMVRAAAGLILLFATWLASAAAHPQEAKVARIGWVAVPVAAAVQPNLDAVRAGLAERGSIEGRNYVLLERYAGGSLDRIPALAAELVAERVDVIVSQGAAIHGVHAAVTTVPIVFGFSGDPVVAGFATSLAHPLGNLTGVTHMSIELNGKRIDMLHEIMPRLERIAILANPTHPGDQLELENSKRAADRLGIRLQYWPVRSATELDAALAGMAADPPQAIVAFPDAIIMQLRERIIGFGLARRIPAVSGWAAFAQSGGLLTYGPKLAEILPAARLLRRSHPEGC